MPDLRKRMGRLNPDEAHPFAPQPIDTDTVGGRAGRSRACGVCDRSFDDPLHGASHESIRERHGPFGQ